MDFSAVEIAPSPSSYDDICPHAVLLLDLSEDYIISMKAKISVVQVCQQWHDIATPFLYEDVRLRNHFSLGVFARSLQSSTDAAGLPDHPIHQSCGHFTQRLRITLHQWDRISRNAEPEDESVDLGNLNIILTLYKNLKQGHVAGFPMFDRSAKLSAPAKQNLLSLQSLYLDSVHLDGELLDGTDNSSQLEILNIDDEERSDGRGYGFPMTKSLSFPRLHTLRLFGMMEEDLPDWISSWDLPALRRVTFGVMIDDSDWDSIPFTFFGKYGPSIVLLDYSPTSIRTSLSFLQHCQSLEHLVLHYASLGHVTSVLSLLPSFVKLDIRLHQTSHCPSPWTSNFRMATFLKQFQAFTERIFQPDYIAHLEILHLSDMRNDWIEEHTWSPGEIRQWQGWIEVFKDLGILQRLRELW
jgi:hypothetical protein